MMNWVHLIMINLTMRARDYVNWPTPLKMLLGVDTTGSRKTSLGGRHLRGLETELAEILRQKVISGLDAVRALAVILVLVDHLMITDHLLGVHPKTGPVGVTIFFVLSGFLITSMLLKEFRRTNDISLRNFYIRRSYRIFPTFYCCWLLTTIVDCLAHQMWWRSAAVSFFYLTDYGRAFAQENVQIWVHMAISWSLAVEEKFYLLWPLILLRLLKRPAAIRILAFIICGLWFYRAAMDLIFHVGWRYLYFTFDMRADALLVGCLLAMLLEDGRTRRACCTVLRWQWLCVLPPLALSLMTVIATDRGLIALGTYTIQPLVIAVMLLQAIYWGAKSWSVCGSVMVKAVAHLSYALYLYHPLAGKILYLLHAPHVGFGTVALTIIMSATSYYLVERPFMRLRDRQAVPIKPQAQVELT